ncbi:MULTISPECIES: phosphopantetheine-binding protein [unclassified Streptomyces]|uniref:phosphopantetheine-binding protein n=1 Tax=unclassified Streptomyces TaxID=2593676 RepID=UPI001CBC6BF5|nr:MULTISPECIES: phosphopantetheine-binding protein [unclassified Streptomyces]WPO74782.1 phosphopantetheine-binding protein [Streptomyces sp. KN37]
MSDSYPAITKVLTGTFGVDPDEVHPEATFDSLGLDSLSLAELSLLVEERTGQRLEDLPPTATLADAAAVLDRSVASGGSTVPAPGGTER